MSMSIQKLHTGGTGITEHVGPVKDAIGYRIFSGGNAGAAHVMAHRMLDENRLELGRRLLGEWLQGRTGSGSEWIHLQFHMAVFDLAAGDWHAAHDRFRDEVLPAVESGENALTDAPQLLWRLALSAPGEVDLCWEPVRRTALARMQHSSDPFTELHNLLALAGAGDLENLNCWMQTRDSKTRDMRLVRGMGVALSAYVTKRYHHAAEIFSSLVPRTAEIGGSRAQNQLFEQIALSSWQRAGETHQPAFLALAA